MRFGRRSRKANVPVEKSVEPGSIEWYMKEWAKDAAYERYAWWIYEQFANEEMAIKLREYDNAMNAVVEEIFGKKGH